MLKSGNKLILMKRFASMTRHNTARWIFIFGVLAGLLFSGGEGIQLFPFQAAEADNSKNTFSVLEEDLKSYALSVHNSGNHSHLLKSKPQKQTNQYLSGGRSTFTRSSICPKLFLKPARNREDANPSHASVFLSSQSDRAPPTF